jgi:hypothetical protein
MEGVSVAERLVAVDVWIGRLVRRLYVLGARDLAG